MPPPSETILVTGSSGLIGFAAVAGQSILDQVKAEPDMFNPEMFAAPAPFWEDKAVAARFLLHDCPPEVVDQAFRRLRPEPGVLGREVSPLGAWPDVPSSLLLCSWTRRVWSCLLLPPRTV